MVYLFTYIYHKNQPDVGKYTIHGSYGYSPTQSTQFFCGWNLIVIYIYYILHLSYEPPPC